MKTFYLFLDELELAHSKEICMKILCKDKLKKNEYFVFDNVNDVINSKKKKIIIKGDFWKENRNLLLEKKISVGVQINSDQTLENIINDIDYFSLIQFNFLSFRDGRPFTYAKLLRGQFKFLKEIRASGHILPDQYIFLIRCGFNTVEIEERNLEIWRRFYKMDAGIYYQ